MVPTVTSRVRSLGSSVFRLATALTIAFVATGAIAFLAYWAYTYPDRQQAKQAEAVRAWAKDLSGTLGMKVQAKTKVVDGMMQIAVDFDGYPEFLKHPSNYSRGFTFEWNDADGFTRIRKFAPVSDFAATVNSKGQPYGLNAQFSQFVSVADYSQLASMEVGWNVQTEIPQQRTPTAGAATDAAPSDHCAPGLNRQERLRRLAKHGEVRETGLGEFSVGLRSITFLPDGEVLSCR